MADNEIAVEELSYETQELGEQAIQSSPGVVGFVVVQIQASPTNRYVEATGFLNGTPVCHASAADNSVPNVISTNKQSFTMPVPSGVRFNVTTNLSNPAGHVRVFRIRA